jgi:hypothetical protein
LVALTSLSACGDVRPSDTPDRSEKPINAAIAPPEKLWDGVRSIDPQSAAIDEPPRISFPERIDTRFAQGGAGDSRLLLIGTVASAQVRRKTAFDSQSFPDLSRNVIEVSLTPVSAFCSSGPAHSDVPSSIVLVGPAADDHGDTSEYLPRFEVGSTYVVYVERRADPVVGDVEWTVPRGSADVLSMTEVGFMNQGTGSRFLDESEVCP